MKKVIIDESKLLLIKENEEKEEVTFYKFFTEVKNFLKKLLDDPIDAKPSKFFKDNDISKSELLNKMLDRGIIKKKENIDEPNDADGKMKSMHYLSYSIPKKDFEHKIKRLYDYFFSDKKKALTESFGENHYSSVATYIFCINEQGQRCVLAGKRRGFGSVGMYNVPTGLVGDNDYNESVEDAAVREVSEEAGLAISKGLLRDAGNTPYSNRFGKQLGKNFAVYLEGTTNDYRLGRGDGENDPFIWIPEDAIDSVPWAFGMDKEVKKLIKYL
jgi:8-oxo-dGTP pyrophosphatase MutT (NUDIX family)